MGVEQSSESVNLGLWGPGAYITMESFDKASSCGGEKPIILLACNKLVRGGMAWQGNELLL